MYQKINNLKGEVEFRKLLARQHVTGETLLPHYYGKEDHDRILLERIDTTRRDLEHLKIRDLRFMPFLEIGAERCHRSLVMTNDYNAPGFAVDISLEQLQSAEHFAELFKLSRLPIRVCCDANKLPFRDGAFPFVFTYEFLHHFPSPLPIMKEIYRVMSDGLYYFSEEPFRTPHISLYKQKNKIYSEAYKKRSRFIRFLERYVSVDNCDEREYGVIENMDISLRDWIRALAVFDSKDVFLSSSLKISSKLGKRITAKNLPNLLLGGLIKGECRKELKISSERLNDMYDLLCCPNCLERGDKSTGELPPLIKNTDYLTCPICKSVHPVVNNVIVLLPDHLLHELYPELEKGQNS